VITASSSEPGSKWTTRSRAENASELDPAETRYRGAVDIQRAAGLYADGWTLRQIGAELGVHWSTVSQQLQRAGVVKRRRGPSAHSASTDQIVELRDQGRTWTEIAEQVDMTKEFVHWLAHQPEVQRSIGYSDNVEVAGRQGFAIVWRRGFNRVCDAPHFWHANEKTPEWGTRIGQAKSA
jgi:Homeodomain-like domain